MAQFTMNTSLVQRSQGASAVAAAAYITGSQLYNQRTGDVADYTHRKGVERVAEQIVVPDDELGSQLSREALWSKAETVEKRRDGTLARRIVVGLPHEVDSDGRYALVKEFAQWVANRYHAAVDFAVHAPDAKGDKRNYHAHLLMTTREIHAGELGSKIALEWSGARLKREGMPSGKKMLHELRQRWEGIQNAGLARLAPGVAKVSCKRLSAQREEKLREVAALRQAGKPRSARRVRLQAIELDREPQRHVGVQATAMERRGLETDRGAARRRAQKAHAELREEVDKMRQLVVKVEKAADERAAAEKKPAAATRQATTKQTLAPVPPVQPMPDAPQKVAPSEPAPPPRAPTVAEINHAEVARIADELERHGKATFTATINARVMMTLYGAPGRELLKALEMGVPDGSVTDQRLMHGEILRFNPDGSRELRAPKGNAADVAGIIRKENDAMKLRADARTKGPENARIPKAKPPREHGGR